MGEQRFDKGVGVGTVSYHAQCLNCRHARKPSAPARGQALCSRVGTLTDVTAYCAGHQPLVGRDSDARRGDQLQLPGVPAA